MSVSSDSSIQSQAPGRAVPRAEHVGSLVRPAQLREAQQRIAEEAGVASSDTNAMMAERMSEDPGLGELQDTMIRDIVDRQRAAGLDVVTDGEFRRMFFTGSFDTAVEGFVKSTRTITMMGPDGQAVERTARPVVAERLRKVASPMADEARFLSSIDAGRFKVTIPAASIYGFYGVFDPGITDRVYADMDEMLDHVVAILRELVDDAIAAGATYVQFDYPFYPLFVNDSHRAQFEKFGIRDADAYLERLLEADAKVVEGVSDGVRTALHLCRGNAGRYWMSSGSLEPVADRVFALPYDSFLVEWDDKVRDGDFSALRHVPKGPTVALGVISTKRPDAESEDDVLREIDEASAYLSIDQLAISPQCGFGTISGMESTTEEVQWRKLELVGRVADRVWPNR